MGSPLGRTLHSGCPKSWKILGTMQFASVVLAASGLLASINAAPQLFGPSPSTPFSTSAASAPRRQDEAAIVGSVISALQPSIAEAVAAALAASSRPSSTTSSSSSGASSSGFVPARDSDATPANYNYIYKVADDGTQTYISQEEQRDGLEVQGTYSYVDPTGAIVTVNYNAGVNGYEETRSRQEGAVKIAPQPAQPTQTSSNGLNTQAIIAQVLAALRPTIQTTVSQFVSRG